MLNYGGCLSTAFTYISTFHFNSFHVKMLSHFVSHCNFLPSPRPPPSLTCPPRRRTKFLGGPRRSPSRSTMTTTWAVFLLLLRPRLNRLPFPGNGPKTPGKPLRREIQMGSYREGGSLGFRRTTRLISRRL